MGDSTKVPLHDESSNFVFQLSIFINNLCPSKYRENISEATVWYPNLFWERKDA